MRKLLFLLLSLVTLSCQHEEPPISDAKAPVTFAGNAMTINYRILVGHPLDSLQKHEVSAIINDTFSEVNAVYNNWNPDSELSRLNKLPAYTEAKISPELVFLLDRTEKVVKLSKGRFDPTVAPLNRLWQKCLKAGRIPKEKEILAILPSIGWDKISYKNGIFYKKHKDTQLDLCGIAKGLCVDFLVERLNSANYKNLLVEWGGEMRSSGEHPEGRPWKIFISNLGDRNPDNSIATLNLTKQAIASSGDYWQKWTIRRKNGQRESYTHIVNPLTKEAIKITKQSIASANVVAPTCTLADGLATAAMLFPTTEEATQWTKELEELFPEITFWITTREN